MPVRLRPRAPNLNLQKRREFMEKGEKLVVIGCGGAGGPAAMLAKKLMPDINVTIVRKEERFIVR
jgi:D-arabinose 1-dehydrogenase-like Zn-dependent alcohol dehydrogenase